LNIIHLHPCVHINSKTKPSTVYVLHSESVIMLGREKWWYLY